MSQALWTLKNMLQVRLDLKVQLVRASEELQSGWKWKLFFMLHTSRGRRKERQYEEVGFRDIRFRVLKLPILSEILMNLPSLMVGFKGFAHVTPLVSALPAISCKTTRRILAQYCQAAAIQSTQFTIMHRR